MHYATFGIVSIDGKVAYAPPIAFWSMGKDISTVLEYYKNKGADIRPLEEK